MELYLEKERQERWFDSMVPALCGSRSWEKLFDLLEATPFFARQAELSQGFLSGADTLERHVLPALVELGEWERFLRFAVTAVNFRGLAESLAEDEVLRALAANGHEGWAVSLVEQVPDPVRRQRQRRIVAAALPEDDPVRHRLLRQVAAELDRVELPDQDCELEKEPLAGAPDADLCRALDLAAALFPKDLRRQVEDVLGSPVGRTGTLLALVDGAQSPGLVQELFERAESYAAMVASTQAEGFDLRRKILIRLACRLCRSEGSLKPVARAAERLLPEEEDELLLVVAAELSRERPDLATEAARRIRSPALQLRALLSVLPPGEELERRLKPESLYRAAATVDPFEDELRALAVLREAPVRPEELARRHLEGIRRPARQIEALIDLAWHALRYQERAFPPARRDLLAAVLPLQQALGVVESDAWLLGITPELAEVGAALGLTNAVAEFQEAADRIVRLDSVPWPARAEALRNLIARIQPVFLGTGEAGADRCRAAASLLDWLSDLPARIEECAGRDELRQHWHEVLPWLMAASRRMPPVVHTVEEEAVWTRGLAELVGNSKIEAGDPAVLSIRRRLRVLGEDSLRALGTAAVEALRSGGKQGGESALCLFLNAYVPSRPGETAAEAIRRALTLPDQRSSASQTAPPPA